MQIQLRKAQRQMKGVRLQYMNDGRIMFDDVAGIRDAKVGLTSSFWTCGFELPGEPSAALSVER